MRGAARLLALGGIGVALAGLPASAVDPSFAAAVGHRPMTLDAMSSVMPFVVVLNVHGASDVAPSPADDDKGGPAPARGAAAGRPPDATEPRLPRRTDPSDARARHASSLIDPTLRRAARVAAALSQRTASRTAFEGLQPLLAALAAQGHLTEIARYPFLGMLMVQADGVARQALSAHPSVVALVAERHHHLPEASVVDRQPFAVLPSDAFGTRQPEPNGGLRHSLARTLLPLLLQRQTGQDGLWSPTPSIAASRHSLARTPLPLLPQGQTGQDGLWSPTPNVAASGAPRAWTELGATGQGATVAVLDSGVDWRHPALSTSYRGRGGGHDFAWFDAVEGSTEPIDPNGHGTHVAGLIAGRLGDAAYGVAPGATWMAARAFDADGEASDRQLLAAADWLMAPAPVRGGAPRPDLAPDIINGSWGLESSGDPLFDPVLSAWRAAGIVAVFAAGNDEAANPPGAVLAPASAPLALAVGALQSDGTVRADSRGGPSLLGGVKPDLTAPGSGTFSTEPGGAFGRRSGTSMAAPHVAGAAALLLGLNPALRPADVDRLLSATAEDAGLPGPDDHYGWGRLDAFAATEAALGGRLAGRILAPGEALQLVVRPKGPARRRSWPEALTRWDLSSGGAFDVGLAAGHYGVTLGGFGYEPFDVDVDIVRGEVTRLEAELRPSARAAVTGRVRSAQGALGTAQVEVVEAAPPDGGEAARAAAATGTCVAAEPVIPIDKVLETTEAVEGKLRLMLPIGRQLLRFSAPGHRAVVRQLHVAEGGVELGDVCLPVAPRLLVVDADAWPSADWYQERIAAYLRQPLLDAGYPHSVYLVDNPRDVPDLGVLARFDVVWWAHQFGSPGTLNAARGDTKVTDALAAYLGGGGRLILSGQDVGWRDAADGAPQYRLAPAFYRDVLAARLVDGITVARTVLPLPGLALPEPPPTVDLAWPRGRVKGFALRPDVLAPSGAAGTTVEALAAYSPSGGTAVIGVSGPRSRHVLVGFGPESAGQRTALANLIDGLVGWLGAPLLDIRPGTPDHPAALFAVEPAGQVSAGLGQVITLTVGVRAGRAAAAGELGVQLPAQLGPADPSAPEWEPSPGGAGGRRWRTAASLAGRETLTRTVAARLIAPAPATEPLVVTATLSSDGRQATSTAQVWPDLADLGGSMLTVTPERLAAGGAVTVTLGLANRGARVADRLEGSVSWSHPFIPLTSSLAATAGSATWTLGDASEPTGIHWQGMVSPSEGVTVSLEGRLPPASPAAATFAAELTQTLSSADWPFVTWPLTAVALAGGPDLGLPEGLTAPAVADAGDNFVAEAVLSNAGPLTASATALLTLPAGVEPGPAAQDMVFDPLNRRLRWHGQVAPHGSRRASWPLAVALGAASGPVVLRLEVTDGLVPAASRRAETALRVRRGEVTVAARLGPEGGRPGDWLEGSVVVTNSGDAAVPLEVVDSLPARAQLDEASVKVTHGSVTSATATLTWPLVLSAGTSASLSYRVQASQSLEPNAPLQHVARVRWLGQELVRSASVIANPLSLAESTLAAWPPSPTPGGQLRYTFTLRSVGTAEARGIAVRVRLPDGTTLVPGSPAGGLVPVEGDHALTWQGRLAAGDTLAFVWLMRLPSSFQAGSRLLTTADVTAKGVPPLKLATSSLIAATDFSGSAKSASRSVVRPGDVVTFTLRASCDGPAAAQVTLTDVLPPGLELVPGSLSSTLGAVEWDAPSRSLRWRGLLAPGDAAQVSLATRVTGAPGTRIVNAMSLADERGTHAAAWAEVGIEAARVFLPWANAP